MWQKIRERVMTMSKPGLLVTILVIVLGTVDLCFVVFGGTGSSVSNFLINAGYKSPVFIIGVGFVCGHLYGQMWEDTPEGWANRDAQKKRDLRTALFACMAYEGLRTIFVYVWSLI